MHVVVTGSAGFIGYHLSRRLLEDGHEVTGFDGMTSYYDVALKHRRHDLLGAYDRFTPVIGRLEDAGALEAVAKQTQPDVIVHLAAQAGVRYSLEAPAAYVDANLVGTFNVLELARRIRPKHLLVASTSSVYGGNRAMPFREIHKADWPLTFYAATKKAGEEMSHSYAHLWSIPTTCLRFFTVYGPWGRPDMAPYKFVDTIARGMPINVYGHGRASRDFTYVDDLVESLARLISAPPVQGEPVVAEDTSDSLSPVAPWRTVNIGGGSPVGLLPFIEAIEAALGQAATRRMMEAQKGDVSDTFADVSLLRALTGFVPKTPMPEGVARLVDWYRSYHS